MNPEDLGTVTFLGPAVDDPDVVAKAPHEIRDLISEANGFILFDGALHVRGACREPAWHSLREAWFGSRAFCRLYPDVRDHDVPFAQDCMGDQFLLRGPEVHRLSAETGEVSFLSPTLAEFFASVSGDPEEFLSFSAECPLRPGELLFAFPPFCFQQASGGNVSLKAVPAEEAIAVHADLAAEIHDLPDGQEVRIVVPDETT
jgi:hypothetical protein